MNKYWNVKNFFLCITLLLVLTTFLSLNKESIKLKKIKNTYKKRLNSNVNTIEKAFNDNTNISEAIDACKDNIAVFNEMNDLIEITAKKLKTKEDGEVKYKKKVANVLQKNKKCIKLNEDDIEKLQKMSEPKSSFESFMSFCDTMLIAEETSMNTIKLSSATKAVLKKIGLTNAKPEYLCCTFSEMNDIIGDEISAPTEDDIITIGKDLWKHIAAPLGLDGCDKKWTTLFNQLQLFVIGNDGMGDYWMYSLKDHKMYEFIHDSNQQIQLMYTKDNQTPTYQVYLDTYCNN